MAARGLALAGLILFFSGYLVWQVKGILEPPRLLLASPEEGELVNGLSLKIRGETEPETTLLVNGQTVMVNEAGRFDMKIDVQQGLSTLTFQAIKKHGKTTTITRHVVVAPPKLMEKVSMEDNVINY